MDSLDDGGADLHGMIVAQNCMDRLFVSDLDGTLLDQSARLSEYSREQLGRLLRSGMPFTVASARSIHTIASILEGVAIQLPVIEFNGAFITDLRTRTSLVCHALEAEIAEAVMRWGLETGVPPFVSTYTRAEQRLYPPAELRNAGIAWYFESRVSARDPRLRACVDPFRTLAEPIVRVTLIGHDEVLAPIEARIHAGFPERSSTLRYENRYSPGWYWLTVQSALATKDRALREVADMYGVALARVTVFGDEVNDIPMFRTAGRGVAVENAIDALKRVASEIIGPHDRDSVVEYLGRVW
jgi:Cof subfamily protein (haloacid dehalogenase superfamily)